MLNVASLRYPARAGAAFPTALVAATAAFLLSGGYGSAASAFHAHPRSATLVRAGTGDGQISHVVVVVQQGRSFDNLFHGFPGADYANSGLNSYGQTITLEPISLSAPYTICSGLTTSLEDIDHRRMDGFNLNCVQGKKPPPNPEYVVVNPSQTKPYFDIAKQYSLGDAFFASQLDGSFEALQYLIAAQAGGAIGVPDGVPWGCDAPSGTFVEVYRHHEDSRLFPCFTYATLGAELDEAKLSWRYYVPGVQNPDYLLNPTTRAITSAMARIGHRTSYRRSAGYSQTPLREICPRCRG